mgnify:CR=1 FL=1
MPDRPLALVTGASSGIGAEYCRQLAARGHDLLVVARDGERLRAMGDALARAHGVTVTPVIADLTTDEGIALVERTIAAQPRLTVLVNNAGFGTTGTVLDGDPTAQRRMLTLHVDAVHRLTVAALPAMTARRQGAIVTVASVASFLASGGNVNYCATKTWQRVYMMGLGVELRGTGVRVQALCPGFTTTEFHQRMGFDQRGRTPAWLWYPADEVVATSLRALDAGGPVVVIPGVVYKIAVFLARHLPLRLVERLSTVYRRDRG